MLYMADAYMGKAHVTADQIGDYNAGVSGSGCVLNVGEQLRAEIVNANLVRIYDGAFIFQGYRRSGITAGSYEDVTIENGTQAQKRNDLICAKYEKDAATSKENLTLAVIKGTPGDTASDPEMPEGDVRSGSAVCYMPLYRVKLDGINLTAVEKLFTVRKTLEEIEGDVAALNSHLTGIRDAVYKTSDCNDVSSVLVSSFQCYDGTGHAPENEARGIILTLTDGYYPGIGYQTTQLFFSYYGSVYTRVNLYGSDWGSWIRLNN